MNEQEAQEMLREWQKNLTYLSHQRILLSQEECEQVIILIRSYLMTFEKGGYPFD